MILDLEAKPDFDSDDEAVIKMKKSAYRRSQDHIAEMLAAEVDGDDEEGDVTLTPVDKDKVKMELKTKDGYKHKMYLQKSRKDVKDVAIRLLGMEDSTVDKVRRRLKVIFFNVVFWNFSYSHNLVFCLLWLLFGGMLSQQVS